MVFAGRKCKKASSLVHRAALCPDSRAQGPAFLMNATMHCFIDVVETVSAVKQSDFVLTVKPFSATHIS